MSYRFLRALLFQLDPERAHNLAVRTLAAGGAKPVRSALSGRLQVVDRRLEQELMGIRFGNPVGLAAGFDKDGIAIQGLGALGFGFVEIGTVTPRAQGGNPRPRLWRHPRAESLQNAMGFNNAGAPAMKQSLSRLGPPPVPVGINVGKNRTTPVADASEDYLAAIRTLRDHGDYFVINISSPNTPGLRGLQEASAVEDLVRAACAAASTPILVKLSPDLEPAKAVDLAGAAGAAGAAGVILTNTTTDYSLLPGAEEVGGLSGRVLREKSHASLRAVSQALFGDTLIISVGGIDSGEEVFRRLRSGASLVQIYTALVYRGPGLVHRVLNELLAILEREGVGHMEEIIGSDLEKR